ncbi:Dyp-type peroxidase domain-containing protein [Streptomyces sp. NPDC093093]|uniref:Dyp-type peroxidase domain-containing protein n=1 Tax=Streptomyces sp. NPDC093093 TaxID=3366025 RepID=UPI0038033EB1
MLTTAAPAESTKDAGRPGPGARTPFHGATQAGILTRRRPYAHLAALDLLPGVDRPLAAGLLRAWSAAAERMTRRETPVEGESEPGIALGAGPTGLTVTFGFGPELFERLGGGRPSPAG